MARRLQQGESKKRSHYWLHPYLAVLLGVVCLFEPLIAIRVVAQPAATEQKSNRATKARQLLQ